MIVTNGFEVDSGWIVNPADDDTATAGAFERGRPDESAFDLDGDGDAETVLQPSEVGSGFAALVTGLTATVDDSNDLDGGRTSVVSTPTILPQVLADASQLEMSFDWYFSHLQDATADDYMRVTMWVLGENPEPFELLLVQGQPEAVGFGTWMPFELNLESFLGETIQIVVEAADEGEPSEIEAGFDSFRIEVVSQMQKFLAMPGGP